MADDFYFLADMDEASFIYYSFRLSLRHHHHRRRHHPSIGDKFISIHHYLNLTMGYQLNVTMNDDDDADDQFNLHLINSLKFSRAL